jgi:hypothetical protein
VGGLKLDVIDLKVYDQVIIRVFESVFVADADYLPFTKADIEQAIRELGLQLSTKNVPDIVYTYRSGRSALPEFIIATKRYKRYMLVREP